MADDDELEDEMSSAYVWAVTLFFMAVVLLFLVGFHIRGTRMTEQRTIAEVANLTAQGFVRVNNVLTTQNDAINAEAKALQQEQAARIEGDAQKPVQVE